MPKHQKDVLDDVLEIEFTAVANRKVFNRTNSVRKERGLNAKVFEIMKNQTDISLSEIAVRLGVSYKTVQRAVADLKRLVLSKG